MNLQQEIDLYLKKYKNKKHLYLQCTLTTLQKSKIYFNFRKVPRPHLQTSKFSRIYNERPMIQKKQEIFILHIKTNHSSKYQRLMYK